MTQAPPLTLDWVKQERTRLKALLADLDAVERVLKQVGTADALLRPKADLQLDLPNGDTLVFEAKIGPTKKYRMLRAISEAPNGLTTSALAGVLKESGNLSPQLSMARGDGLLALEHGNTWRITPKGREYLVAQEQGGSK